MRARSLTRLAGWWHVLAPPTLSASEQDMYYSLGRIRRHWGWERLTPQPIVVWGETLALLLQR